MKKTLFFLACIIGLLTSCNQDDDQLTGSTQTNEGIQKVRMYGVKRPDPLTTRGVVDENKLWNTNNGIAIKFLNQPSDPAMLSKIKNIACEWERYAGITFNFVESSAKADVRIAFDWNGNDYLTWSYTGTDARFVRKQTEPTAVFGGLENLYEEELKADVLRVFGQILGLEYEQRHQDWTFWWDEARVEAYWKKAFKGLDFDWDEVRDYVYTPLDGNNAIYSKQTPELDELSIMVWPLYSRIQTTNVLANYELSEQDKKFIGELYPKGDPNTTDPTVIVKGRANVLAQYVSEGFTEFVRPSDGGVGYIVYNDTSAVSPGAKVKGLPGIKDPSKVYIADANGRFVVPKEDLPIDLAVADRFGPATEVEYMKSTGQLVKEVSAQNSFVPNKIQLKLALRESNPVYLSGGYINVYTQVLRKTDPSKDWEAIPSYLGNLSQKVVAYELSDSINPSSYTSSSKVLSYTYVSLSSSSIGVSVSRMRKASAYVSQSNLSSHWDGKDHYFNLVLESYYGERPHANVVIKMAPIQYGPLIKNVKAYGYDEELNIFSKLEGEFDFSSIDKSLIFKQYLAEKTITQGKESFRYFSPQLDDIENIKGTKSFLISFNVYENSADNSANRASISAPGFVVATPYVNSNVYLSFSSINFVNYGTIGQFIFDTSGTSATPGLLIKRTNSGFTFPDVPVQNLP